MRGAPITEETVSEAVTELYDGSQRKVPCRAQLISTGVVDDLAALEAVPDAAGDANVRVSPVSGG